MKNFLYLIVILSLVGCKESHVEFKQVEQTSSSTSDISESTPTPVPTTPTEVPTTPTEVPATPTEVPATPAPTPTPEPASVQQVLDACSAKTVGQCYFIEDNNNKASDSNDGSFDNPFKTIQKAAYEATSPGDIVYIRGGQYFDDTVDQDCGNLPAHTGIRLCGSGSQSNPITFTAFPGEEVVLDQKSTGPGFVIYSRDHIIIKDITINNTLQAGVWTNVSGRSDNIQVINLTIDTVYNPQGKDTNVAGVKFDNCTNCVVRNSTIRNVKFSDQPANQNATGIHSYGMENFLIEGNTISDTTNAVFHKRFGSEGSVGGVIRNNHFHDLGIGLRIDNFGSDAKIQDYTITNNIFQNVRSAVDTFGIYGYSGSKNLKFENNIIKNHTFRGFILASFDSGVFIKNNIFDGGSGYALQTIEQGYSGVIEDSDYNCYSWVNSTSKFWYLAYSNNYTGDINVWRNLSGHDYNSVEDVSPILDSNMKVKTTSMCSSLGSAGLTDLCLVGDGTPFCE